MIPECMLQNIAQPQRNPAAGENISRRNTYTPPVRGYAEASSAQMLAPNHVSAPAAIHTSTIPPKLGTARLTSDGCTKIELPTIVPTTIATACTRPIDRVSAGRMRDIAYTPTERSNDRRSRMVRLCVSAAMAAFLMAGAETPGTLAVASEPAGAAVYVDGQFVGQTPLDVKNLQPGDHRVRLVKDGYLENGRVVNVSAGKTGSLQVRLTARNASDALPDGQAGGGISSGGGGGGSKKWLWIGLAGGGAAATAVALATRNHAPKLGAVTASPTTGLMSASIITFNASASDDDGDSLTYTWDFGDGSSTATGNAPTHVYNAANTFTARVTVSDGKKDVSSTTSVAIRSLAGTWRGTLEAIAETFVFTQSTTTVGGTL